MMTDVIVIGGGAAGMMAAYAAGCSGCSVLLLEKNEKLGKKLYITGKGRCNVTNACDLDGLIRNQCRNGRFLYSAFRNFSNEDLQSLLEAGGCPLKIERGERVFPVSDHASDVTKALTGLLKNCGVKIRLKTEVSSIDIRDDQSFQLRTTAGESFEARKLIIATGGLSYPTTGSTGDGYRFARELGLCLKPCIPSLVALLVREQQETTELSGLSLKNVRLRLYLGAAGGKIKNMTSAGAKKTASGDRLLYEEQGELLFTHKGLSGPLVLTASSYAGELAAGEEKGDMLRPETCLIGRNAYISIDLKPALDQGKLDQRLLRDLEGAKNQDIRNVLRSLLPASLIAPVLRRSSIVPEKKANSITREERQRLLEVLKDLRYDLVGLGGFNEAVITKGGVDVKEIDPRTMEVKKIPGLYFAGEVLDIDARTGGFNLQDAWSTGYAAGSSAGERCFDP